MQIEAGKLDWLKERKDYHSNPVARAATRLLEHQYIPHGEDLYPWILREVRRGNITLPGQYGDHERPGPWLKLVQMEMAAEKELARRQHLVDTDPTLTSEQTDPWHEDSNQIDWDNLERAPWNALHDYVDSMNEGVTREKSPWEDLNSYNGGLRFQIHHPSPNGYDDIPYALKPDDLKQWMDTLQDRAKRRQGVDPMQFSAPDFHRKMHSEWLPEYEERQRQGLGRVLHTFPDRWTVRTLQNAEEAEREGEDMGHCIGNYGDDVESGKSHLFSLRDPSNRPHASWEIKPRAESIPDSLLTEYGLGPEYRNRVQWWLDELREGYGNETGEPLSEMHQRARRLAEAILRGDADPSDSRMREPWHGGDLVQVQGKENDRPIPEYQSRIRDWFASLPEEARPSNLGGTAYRQENPNFLGQPMPNPNPGQMPDGPIPGRLGEGVPAGGLPDPPQFGEFLARTMEHHPAPAHKNRVTGRICHCPWGPERELWSWGEDSRPEQAHRHGREDADAASHDRPATIAQVRVPGVKPSAHRLVASEGAAQGDLSHFAWVDVGLPDGDASQALGAEGDIPHIPVPLTHRSTTVRSTPAEVAKGTVGVKEHDKIHSRQSISDRASEWDWYDEGEFPEDYEVPEFRPWTKGEDGKGLLSPEGQVITWPINAMGDPHHDTVSGEQDFPYAAKLTIRPNGETFIAAPDELNLVGMDRDTAEGHLAREAPKHGLHLNRGYTAKVVACPTCGDPLKGDYGTFCPRCQWSEDNANLDSDPLSNPPDPTIDLHRGIQSRVIPTHRHWYSAVSDIEDGGIGGV